MKKDKIRDMIRSILPSKAAKTARDEKRIVHRRNRTRVRQELRQYNKKGGWNHEEEEQKLETNIWDSDCKQKYAIRWMKVERRQADKISHFVRWCNEKTSHISKDDPQARYFYISSLIGGPKGIIREHALGHFLNPRFSFNPFYGHYRYKAPQPKYPRIAIQKAIQKAYEFCPSQLNQVLKRDQQYWTACRDDEICVKIEETQRIEYTFQSVYGYRTRSFTRPTSTGYREGTLNHRLVKQTIRYHNDGICKNRVLVLCQNDVERLANVPYRVNLSTLIDFLIQKGFLEQR